MGRPRCRASVAFLAIGTGISAGVVLDGALLRGDNSFAGEVGHVVADPDGVVCACGLRGCLETIAAGPAIGRQADEAIAAGRSTVLLPGSTAADVFRAASVGDAVAVEIVDRVADHLARAIRSLALTLGVGRVVIGGGVAAAGPALLDPIRSAHRPRAHGLAARPGRPGRCDRRAAGANRGTHRTRSGSARAPPHRLA